jgi:hypothetical protein
VFEGLLAVFGVVGESDALNSLAGGSEPGGGGVDADESGTRLLRGPEAGSAGPEGQVDHDLPGPKLEECEQPLDFGESEEPDRGELGRELAAVGGVSPDSVERLTVAEGVVHRVVAVTHGVKDAVVGDGIGEVTGHDRRVGHLHNTARG